MVDCVFWEAFWLFHTEFLSLKFTFLVIIQLKQNNILAKLYGARHFFAPHSNPKHSWSATDTSPSGSYKRSVCLGKIPTQLFVTADKEKNSHSHTYFDKHTNVLYFVEVLLPRYKRWHILPPARWGQKITSHYMHKWVSCNWKQTRMHPRNFWVGKA